MSATECCMTPRAKRYPWSPSSRRSPSTRRSTKARSPARKTSSRCSRRSRRTSRPYLRVRARRCAGVKARRYARVKARRYAGERRGTGKLRDVGEAMIADLAWRRCRQVADLPAPPRRTPGQGAAPSLTGRTHSGGALARRTCSCGALARRNYTRHGWTHSIAPIRARAVRDRAVDLQIQARADLRSELLQHRYRTITEIFGDPGIWTGDGQCGGCGSAGYRYGEAPYADLLLAVVDAVARPADPPELGHQTAHRVDALLGGRWQPGALDDLGDVIV